LIHQHLSFAKLSDNSKAFINSFSFKLMSELNKLFNAIYSQEKKEYNQKTTRDILAISLIDYSKKFAATLSKWTKMNLEIVILDNNSVDFFSFPAETTNLLLDRKISELLSVIGDKNALDFILNREYSALVDLGGKILKRALMYNYNYSESDELTKLIKLNKFRNNPVDYANKLFQLYVLIEERLKLNSNYIFD